MNRPVRFAQSARKHRIGKAHALFVMSTEEPEVIYGEQAQHPRLLWIGPDDRGLELEVLAVVEPDHLLVIHVMPYHFRRGSR